MAVVRIRGIALPDNEHVDLYGDGDRWTTDPVPGAELVAQGWILPGLVDAHTHPGAQDIGAPLDEKILREDLRDHLAAGVTLIRSPGLAGEPPEWFGRDGDTPRAFHAGPWIAQAGQFFDNWGRRPDPAELPSVAAEQAGRTGWAKLIIDWRLGDQVLPVEVLREVVAAVHAVGGRVAVHTQQAEGGRAAVEARVDSIEHGMCLDPALLPELAGHGIALTPTLAVINASLARDRPPGPVRDWMVAGASVHGQLVANAVEAGVTVLAGTDSRPHGRIAGEISAMVEAGVPTHEAIGAASWIARAYLGLPGLLDGAPADAVVYESDPRADLTQLDNPLAVIVRGKRIR
jgi:imidazolonepropionase-like amidohydrolase